MPASTACGRPWLARLPKVTSRRADRRGPRGPNRVAAAGKRSRGVGSPGHRVQIVGISRLARGRASGGAVLRVPVRRDTFARASRPTDCSRVSQRDGPTRTAWAGWASNQTPVGLKSPPANLASADDSDQSTRTRPGEGNASIDTRDGNRSPRASSDPTVSGPGGCAGPWDEVTVDDYCAAAYPARPSRFRCSPRSADPREDPRVPGR
jgi:hypothetical protein